MKTKIPINKEVSRFKSDVVFIMLINVKMPTVVGILTLMSRINFLLSWVEHEKSFITSGPGAGIIFEGDSERFAQFSAKNLIEIGLMGEKSHGKMVLNKGFC